ncbi:helix-turn-helix transcriptional regulator [Elizabethkingia miricola]|uniref:helix-turn-helix transcriptional regulator n=1 Tax=Elizabethkingia miricola TaxID=172045 RepID=UPI001A450A80|nr:helix-turn-helix transcriptional regulator [Chryseobacterium gambrini]
MTKNEINRLRVVLAEKGLTNKWLAEKVKKNPTTISRWCNNDMQPSLETLLDVATALQVDIKDLLWSSKKQDGR